MMTFGHIFESHPFHSIWKSINLAVGNSKRINCKVPKYKTRISLAIMTLYLVAFVVGIFMGDLVANKVIEIERFAGIISTGMVYAMGSSVIIDRFKNRKHHLDFASLVSATLILTQTAFVFNLFPIEITNLFYYFTSTIAMGFVWVAANFKKNP